MNISKTSALENRALVQSELQKNLAQVGSQGQAGIQDLAALGISDRLGELLDSYQASERKLLDGRTLLRHADGALSEIESLTGRLRELAVQSADETLLDAQRADLQTEFSLAREELDRLAESTEYAGVNLLDGSRGQLELQLGGSAADSFELQLPQVSSRALGLEALDISQPGASEDALLKLDAALKSLSGARDKFGAADFELANRNQVLGLAQGNLLAAKGLVRTVGSVLDSAELVSRQVASPGSKALQVQGDLLRSLVQNLLRP